jgi:hypothetical protein
MRSVLAIPASRVDDRISRIVYPSPSNLKSELVGVRVKKERKKQIRVSGMNEGI